MDQPEAAAGAPHTEISDASGYVIAAASSSQDRRPLTLKHGDSFGVFDNSGDVFAGPGRPEGLFHCDTRHLSRFFLLIDNTRPLLLSSTLRDDNATLTCDLTNPDLPAADGRPALDHDIVHIRRSRFLWKASWFERIVISNYDDQPRRFAIAIGFAADFADVFEVRGTKRERRGVTQKPVVTKSEVTLTYTGLDERIRKTRFHFDPAPTLLKEDRAVFELDLKPRETRSLFVRIDCDDGELKGPPRRDFFLSLRDARRALRASSRGAAEVTSSNDIFNEALRRSVSDIYMLVTELPEGPYPYAGIPWFSTVFGRDAIITAMETLWLDPSIAKGVLKRLAATQAKTVDPASDAEPGKILHEARAGEMARTGEVPFRHYYGSVDSTPLFLMLAGAYFERTADIVLMRALWPSLQAALNWIDEYGDADGDGFVEYGRRTEQGLLNQGWKDSHDSVFHADGTLAKGPIALVEVQAYVYAAWRSCAEIARRLGEIQTSLKLSERAERLKRQFDDVFFDEEMGCYILALDGDKEPCRVRASNAGHALFAGVAYPERAALVARALMDSPFFCGWGVRTVASTEARYNPMSYHNGSIWPHDNAMIATGLSRYGFRREAARIFEGLFAASTYIDLRRLPELFCGFPRQQTRGPTFYPVACSPQAWAAAAPLMIASACLGLSFEAGASTITFSQPTLPDFCDEIVLRRLAVANGSADIALRRSGKHVVVDVLDRRGDVRILTVS